MCRALEDRKFILMSWRQVRYWDYRSAEKMAHYAPPVVLPSDSRNRTDRNALAAKDYKKAQVIYAFHGSYTEKCLRLYGKRTTCLGAQICSDEDEECDLPRSVLVCYTKQTSLFRVLRF